MVRKEKYIVASSIIAIMLANLTGCNFKISYYEVKKSSRAVKNKGIVYLSDWKEDEVKDVKRNPVLASAIKNYENKYNSKVNINFSSYADKQGKLTAMLAAGTPPDVYEPIDGFPQFSINDYAQPIDDLINLKNPMWKDVKDAYDATEWKGKHNFVVISKGPQDVVWYNKTLFKKNRLETPYELYKKGDWNWNTFRDLAIKLTQDTDGDKVIDQWGMSTGPEPIIASTGNDLVKINGRTGTMENNLKNPDVLNAFSFFREAGPAKYNIIQPSLNGYMDDFEKGKIAMTMGATYADTIWWKDMMKRHECSFVPAPRYPNNYDYYVGAQVDLWMIPRGAQNPKGAASFLVELRKAQINPEIQKISEDEDRKRGWSDQEVEMNNELQKLKYTYVFFPGVGCLGDDRWAFWNDLRVNGTPVDKEIEKHYNFWNNQIDITSENATLKHNVTTAARGAPKIDGEIDDAWSNAEEITTDQEKTTPDTATAKVRLLYDTDTLYVLAQVKDNKIMCDNKNPWECDSVEIFIDENKSLGTHYDDNTIQLRIGADGNVTGSGPAWDDGQRASALTSAVKRVNGGYIVETAYKFREVKAKAGTSMGFNVRVNDEEETGSRKGTSVWNADEEASHISPSRFGVVYFK